MQVFNPVLDDTKETEKRAIEITIAAEKLGINLDLAGFTKSWLAGMHVIVDRDTSTGEITSMAFLVTGVQWNLGKTTATILAHAGSNEAGLIEYAKQLASLARASFLVYDTKKEIINEDGSIDNIIRKIML